MGVLAGIILGAFAWFLVRYVIGGFYTVAPNERAVKTVFGRVQRIGNEVMSPGGEEGEIYPYPRVKVIPPGGPYFKFPWEQIYKVSVAIETTDIGMDTDNGCTSGFSLVKPKGKTGVLEAVTKDQLNTGITGQIRYHVCENNLYAYIFGIKNPRAHILGFFHSILREKIANFEAKGAEQGDPDDLLNQSIQGISINDLRKNLRDINDHMEQECAASAKRYGIILDAALITGIDPPDDVESALAAINTAHNQVSSDISLAQASADQTIVQSKRAVEIETLNAQAEVEPLNELAKRLKQLKDEGGLTAYLRNVRLGLFSRASAAIVEDSNVESGR